MRPPAYHLAMPVHYGSGVVFASPHSGRDYSDSFLEQSVLDRNLIRSSEDAFVDQLFACALIMAARFYMPARRGLLWI